MKAANFSDNEAGRLASLRESEARFRQLAENIQEVFWMTNLRGNQMLYISPGYEKIWNRTCASLYQSPLAWLEAIHPGDRDRVREAAQSEKQIRGEYNIEYRIVRADGSLRWIHDRAFPVRNEQGEVYRIAGIAEDITERKRAEEILRIKDSVLASATAGIAIAGLDERITYANAAWLKMHGYESLAPVLGTTPLDHVENPADARMVIGALRAQGRWTGEVVCRRRDGSTFPAELACDLAMDSTGQPLSLLASFNDITVRKQADIIVQNERERLRQILDGQFGLVGVLSLDGTVVDVNQTPLMLFGTSRDEVVGRLFWEIGWLQPEAIAPVKAAVAAAAQGEITRFDVVAQFPGIGRRDVDAIFHPLKDATGQIINVIGFGVDVTDRKQAEAKLGISEDRLQQAVRCAQIGIFDHDHLADTIYWSPEQRAIHGWSADRPIHMADFIAMLHPDDRQRIEEAVRRAHDPMGDGLFDVEHRLTRPSDGKIRWTNTRSTTFFEGKGAKRRPVRTVGAVVDITESKLTEVRIRQLNRTYVVLSDINQLIVRTREPQAMLEGACRLAVEKGGFRMAWIGMLTNNRQVVKPMAAAGVVEGYLDGVNIDLQDTTRRVGPTAKALLTGEHQVCNDIAHDEIMAPWRAAALQRGYRSSASFPLLINGKAVGTFNLYVAEPGFFDVDELRLLDESAMDIAFALEGFEREREKHSALERLHESEERFRQLAENIAEVFWITDVATNQILYISPAYEKIWGSPRERLYATSQAWLEAVHPEDRERLRQSAQSSQQVGTFDDEYRIIRPDGGLRWIHARGFPVHNEKGEVYRVAGVAVDLTERRKNERIAIRSQRLESIGTLAGGLAHDLNNALAPILMTVEMLRSNYPAEPEMLDTIQASAQRGADMVRQLLTFAKGAEGERVGIQCRHLLLDIEKIIKSTFPKNIKLEVRHHENLPIVLGDATQLHQVLLNLCVNARDAMPDGGTLTLKTDAIEIDGAYAAAVPDAKLGYYVMLQVTDTGTGIAPEILDRIFDPFFTTKSPDKGTGLGLSTTLGIVKGHGGFVNVNSQVGRGSTFTVYLPANNAGSETVVGPEVGAEFSGHGELILFVDDEAPIRRVARAVLQRLNFKAITAADGTEGLVQVAEHRVDVRAILTDLHMPHMDGLNFVRALRRILPEIPVVLASGRMDDPAKEEFKKLGVTIYLDKPFTEARLAEVLKSIFAPK